MKVAIVGAGISGLVAAHTLHPRHDVTVFEAADYVGGHTNTVRVDTRDETLYVDTGFIVFNDRNYPNFERLLRALGVASQPSKMAFSVADSSGDFEYSSASPNGLFATRANLVSPHFHRMILDLARFNRAARRLLEEYDREISLGEWLERQRFSRAFIERLIIPQASAVWSAPPSQRWSFPARFLVEFFDNHGMLALHGRPRWRVVRGGSASYVQALIRPFAQRIRLSTPVQAVSRHPDHVAITARGCEAERFDEVVFATHSDQALGLLSEPTDAEHEILSSIPYQPNEAVLHTDTRMLPRRRRAWASWNYHLAQQPSELPTVTYHMNALQSLESRSEFCVTLNRGDEIDPSKVIRRISYAHPVFSNAGVTAQRRHAEISGLNRTSYCGAYWGWGFHEDGVVSALRTTSRFGGGL